MVALKDFQNLDPPEYSIKQTTVLNKEEIHLFTISITLQRDSKREVSLYVNGDSTDSVIVDSRKDIKQCVIDMIESMDFERVDEA